MVETTTSRLTLLRLPMLVSELLSIAAAVCIALSGMLIAELRGRVRVLTLTRWQMTAAFFMTAVASLVVGGWRSIDPWQLSLLAASGFFGIIIGGITYFAAIYAAGARTAALLFSLTSPFALLLGYVFLDEVVTAQQGLGIGLVLIGIVMAVGRPERLETVMTAPGVTRPAKLPWLGIACGTTTALCQALGVLLARPAMAAGAEPFTAMAIRAGIGALFFSLLVTLPFVARATATSQSPSIKSRAIAFSAAFFGTALGTCLLLAALAHGNVGIVATLSSMTPIVILPMIWIRTGLRPVATAWLGAFFAVVGTALISL
ncbi:drug/metabolite transporter (DMT)-like permease [Rhodoligotrophos appendicifer]|uniref:DMT family transporter n=1 Tax=Rhodoligotrophos appendicifer TaxID=987056 RepID=UPI0011801ED2|nr:DMT family transporter [Rhodoligotrophos appendicifer]